MSLVFDQLIADIKEANIQNCSVATDTSVCFNIGQSSYVRVKKVVTRNLRNEYVHKNTVP